ncbi:hypothetical protein ACGFNV_46525 [Streptomyces sp. NPDC048751]|uniref:hypothetical protein n=1 Tax=Streptomyces sp. NPDC048751 TaxID=3365591 RepID=UPI0037161EA6
MAVRRRGRPDNVSDRAHVPAPTLAPGSLPKAFARAGAAAVHQTSAVTKVVTWPCGGGANQQGSLD